MLRLVPALLSGIRESFPNLALPRKLYIGPLIVISIGAKLKKMGQDVGDGFYF